jgi:hypothetical protein
MAEFEDLSVIHPSGRLVAVGWLGRESLYERGYVSTSVFAKLVDLLADPWQPNERVGMHYCDLCRFTGGNPDMTYRGISVRMGTANLYVPDEGYIFVAPSLILHYIDAHEYAPPETFCAAVLACPPVRSPEYFRALIRGGLHDVFPSVVPNTA